MDEPQRIYRMEVGTAEFGAACEEIAQKIGGVAVRIQSFPDATPDDMELRMATIKYNGYLIHAGVFGDEADERDWTLVREEARKILLAGGVLVTLTAEYDQTASERLERVADEAWQAQPSVSIPDAPP